MHHFIDSLTVIIVVYNTALEDCESFQSIKRICESGDCPHIFVYDNSAQPQQIYNYPGMQITYLHDPTNPGVSKAYNAGAAHARNHQKEWVLLLDQDTTLPATILAEYEKAVKKNPGIFLFVPILYLNNGKIFSPCIYAFKRGFHPGHIAPGTHSFKWLSPVNSGILVNTTAFWEVGGYNEKVKLDFSDFQFIRRFRKIYPRFYVIDEKCKQDFSDDTVSFSSQAIRFSYYCEGAGNIEKDGIWDQMQYSIILFLRALRLTLRYRHFGFIRTFYSNFIRSPKRGSRGDVDL